MSPTKPSSVIGSTLARIVRGPGSVPGWGLGNVINVSEGYIQNLETLGPLLHVEKFVVVVVGGWWWWVCKAILVIILDP